MTNKEFLLACKALGISARVRDGEYRVTYPLATFGNMARTKALDWAEIMAAYETDAESALDTAKDLARYRDSGLLLCHMADYVGSK